MVTARSTTDLIEVDYCASTLESRVQCPLETHCEADKGWPIRVPDEGGPIEVLNLDASLSLGHDFRTHQPIDSKADQTSR